MSTQMIVAIRVMDTIIQATIICECANKVKWGKIETVVNNNRMKCNLSNKAYYLWADKANTELRLAGIDKKKRAHYIINTNTSAHSHNTIII